MNHGVLLITLLAVASFVAGQIPTDRNLWSMGQNQNGFFSQFSSPASNNFQASGGRYMQNSRNNYGTPSTLFGSSSNIFQKFRNPFRSYTSSYSHQNGQMSSSSGYNPVTVPYSTSAEGNSQYYRNHNNNPYKHQPVSNNWVVKPSAQIYYGKTFERQPLFEATRSPVQIHTTLSSLNGAIKSTKSPVYVLKKVKNRKKQENSVKSFDQYKLKSISSSQSMPSLTPIKGPLDFPLGFKVSQNSQRSRLPKYIVVKHPKGSTPGMGRYQSSKTYNYNSNSYYPVPSTSLQAPSASLNKFIPSTVVSVTEKSKYGSIQPVSSITPPPPSSLNTGYKTVISSSDLLRNQLNLQNFDIHPQPMSNLQDLISQGSIHSYSTVNSNIQAVAPTQPPQQPQHVPTPSVNLEVPSKEFNEINSKPLPPQSNQLPSKLDKPASNEKGGDAFYTEIASAIQSMMGSNNLNSAPDGKNKVVYLVLDEDKLPSSLESLREHFDVSVMTNETAEKFINETLNGKESVAAPIQLPFSKVADSEPQSKSSDNLITYYSDIESDHIAETSSNPAEKWYSTAIPVLSPSPSNPPKSIKDILSQKPYSYPNNNIDSHHPVPKAPNKPLIQKKPLAQKGKRVSQAINAITNIVLDTKEKKKQVLEAALEAGTGVKQHHNAQPPKESLRHLIKAVRGAIAKHKATKALTVGEGFEKGSAVLNAIGDSIKHVSKNPPTDHFHTLLQSIIPVSGGLTLNDKPFSDYLPSSHSSSDFSNLIQKPLSFFENLNLGEAVDSFREAKTNIEQAVEKIKYNYKHPFDFGGYSDTSESFSQVLQNKPNVPSLSIADADPESLREKYSQIGEQLFQSVSNILKAFRSPFASE